MKKLRIKALLGLVMTAMLVFLAACTPVGGVDLNKVLLAGLDTTSFEAKASMGIEFVGLDPAKAKNASDAQTAAIMQIFNNAKLDLDSIKMQDTSHMSLSGTLTLEKGKIPFALSLTQSQLVIQLDGNLNKPIVFNLTENSQEAQDLQKELATLSEKLAENSQKLLQAAGAYITDKLPNPKTISVDPVTETIHGESVNLHKIHAEITGEDLIGLGKALLENIVKDEEGLQTFLNQLYDILAPILEEMMKISPEMMGDAAGGFDLGVLLQNKALVVNFIQQAIMEQANNWLEQLNQLEKDLASGKNQDLASILNKNSYVKMNLYVDRNDLRERKSDLEIMIAPMSAEQDFLSGIKITASGEMWNINKPVTADIIEAGSDAYSIQSFDKPARFIKSLNKDGLLYDLMKNDLKLTSKQFVMSMNNDDLQQFGFDAPYIKSQRTLVPAAYVADQLDADVAWDGAKRQVTITDILSGKTIVLTIGSTTALVDGQQVTLDVAAEIKNSRTFVPVNFIVTQLGGQIQWDGPTRTITVVKE